MKELNEVALFKETGALQQGHFLLSSGLHSGQYVQCALVLQHPEYAERLGRSIAERFKSEKITVIAGPAIGGIVIAHEVGRALGVRCVFGERQNGAMTLRRGFSIGKDDRVLVVEDVITTGGSLKELADFVKSTGAALVGAASVIDRSSKEVDFGARFESLVKLDIKTFKPDECPLCKSGTKPVKPGSRK